MTPNDLITAIVTEAGVFRPPFDTQLVDAVARRRRPGGQTPGDRRCGGSGGRGGRARVGSGNPVLDVPA